MIAIKLAISSFIALYSLFKPYGQLINIGIIAVGIDIIPTD